MPAPSPCAMADLKDIVAINVRRLRNERGWIQEDLADRVGLSARYVGQIERSAGFDERNGAGALGERSEGRPGRTGQALEPCWFTCVRRRLSGISWAQNPNQLAVRD